MEKTLNRSELEAQLSGKAASISRRVEALQKEVGALSLRRIVEDRPWVAVAAAVAGGLLVGLLFGGRGRPRGKTSALHAALIDGYVEAVGDDVRRLTSKGKEAGKAVTEALRDRVPVILYAPEEVKTSRGVLSQTADLAFKTAAGFAIKAAIDYATSRIDLEKLVDEIVSEAEAAPDGSIAPGEPVGTGA